MNEDIITRARLKALGFRSICISSDLFPYGIRIRHWMRLADFAEIVEYTPRMGGAPTFACTWAQQIAFHEKIGANILPPGEQWCDMRNTPLYVTTPSLAQPDDADPLPTVEEIQTPHVTTWKQGSLFQ